MPRKETPVRVEGERGLYRSGTTFIACVAERGTRRPRWRTLGEVGITKARRLRDEFAVEVRQGNALPAEAGKALFREVAAAWLAEQQHLVDVGELRPKTYEAYEVAVRLHLDPCFGSQRVQALGPDHLRRWHSEQRRSGAARSAIRGRWIALRGVLGLAVRSKLVATNPADLLTRRERPKPGEPVVRVLSDKEMGLVLARAPWRYRLFVAVMLFAGLRISEALGLVWSEIDFDEGRILVRHQLDRSGQRVALKTGYGRRDVILMSSLARLLKEAKLAAVFSGPYDPVFATASGKALSARNGTRAFHQATGYAAQKAAAEQGKAYTPTGIEDVTPHVLRHTFASMLIFQGRDVTFVADQLGHSDPAFTLRRYAHLFRAAKQAQEARDQLEGEFGHLLGAVAS